MTVGHEGGPTTALAVMRGARPAHAQRAMEGWLASRRIAGEVHLRGALADHFLDEAAMLADGLAEGEVRTGAFGFDNPRSSQTQPGLTAPPNLRTWAPSPDTLRALLFAAPIQRGGSAPTEQVYAVLDGAAVFGLPELLETAGLQHACLFQGKAARDYAASAPWLVRLTPDHRLTRILTDTDGRKGPLSWGAGPGLLIRSPLSLHGLRRQLRIFTMILDAERGRRLFFRFYDPRTFRTVIVNARPEVTAEFMRGIRMIACPDAVGDILTFARG